MWTWLKNFIGITDKKEVLVNPVVVIENKDEIVNTIVIETEVKYLSTPDPVAVIDIDSTTDYNSMKKDELLALAKEKGLKANASMNKKALINLING